MGEADKKKAERILGDSIKSVAKVIPDISIDASLWGQLVQSIAAALTDARRDERKNVTEPMQAAKRAASEIYFFMYPHMAIREGQYIPEHAAIIQAQMDSALTDARAETWDAAIDVVCNGSTNKDRRTGHVGCWVRHQRYIITAIEAAKDVSK